MYKELKIKGNVAIFQMISMRDKQTGLYLPCMDGNINSTLHRIYNNINDIGYVIMTLPPKSYIDTEQLKDLNNINSEIFKSKIRFYHLDEDDYYGKNVAETRKRILADDRLMHFVNNDLDLVISEFPIKCITNNDNIVEVVYNYNWNAVDDTNELLNQSLISELALAQEHDTYLFSDIQIKYWMLQDVSKYTYLRRSTNIYNKELFNLLANRYVDSKNLPEIEMVKLLKSMEAHIVFFPMRIDDTRYVFGEVLRYCEDLNIQVVITNPTNAPVPESNNIIDLSNTTDKRTLYFSILKSLRENDMIFHYETDVHISLLEQLSITDAKVLHQITNIESYLK